MRLESVEIDLDFGLSEVSVLPPRATGQARIDELLDLLPDTISPARRIHLFQEAARIYVAELNQPEAALVVLQAALLEDLEYAPVIDALSDLAEFTNSWPTLLADLMASARDCRASDPMSAAQMWTRVASWYLLIELPEHAASAMQEALAIDPSNTAALELKLELQDSNEDWPAYIETARLLIACGVRPARHMELLLRCGELASTTLDDELQAIEHYRAAHDFDASNRKAIDALEGLYRATENTASLCRILWKKAKLLTKPEERLLLELEVAHLLEHELDNLDQARRIYQRLTSLDEAVEVLKKRARASESGLRAELHYRISRMLEHCQAQEVQVEWHLQEALSHDPEHASAGERLIERYEGGAEWGKCVRLYEERARRSKSPESSLRSLMKAAKIYKQRLNNSAKAVELCQQARSVKPGLRPALKLLADVHYEAEEWQALAPLVDALLASDSKDPPEQIARLHLMDGACARAKGDLKRAESSLEVARAKHPRDPEILRVAGELAFARENYPRVVQCLEPLLAGDFLKRGKTRAQLHYLLGEAQHQLGRDEAALAHFKHSLQDDRQHLEAAQAELRLRRAHGEWPAVARAIRNRLETATGSARAQLYAELGDIQSSHLATPQEALESYEASLEAEPDTHRVMQRILDLAASLENWALAYKTIERFAELESEQHRKGSYYLAAAEICRDKLGMVGDAVALYDLCLDAFFHEPASVPTEALERRMKPFADLDAILTRAKDWRQQEQAYRRMIKRLSPGHPLLANLWHSLAEIYRSRLKKLDSATAALEVARDLAPDSLSCREQLAELYVVAGPDHIDKAIAEHQQILDRDAHRHTSYRALADLYKEKGSSDRYWNLCQALRVLQKATSEDEAYFRANQLTAMRLPRRSVPAVLWSSLVHPQQDAHTSSILMLLSVPLLSTVERTARSRGLKSKEAVPPGEQSDQRLYALQYMAKVLGLEPPTLYVQEKRALLLSSEILSSRGQVCPHLVLGADYLSLRDESVRAFVAGQQLCRLRPENWISMVFPDPEQTQAMLHWTLEGRADGGSDELVQRLERVRVDNAIALEQLRIVSERIAESGIVPDARRWHHGQVKTCDRVGLLLCSDLGAAVGAISNAGGHSGGATGSARAERVSELLRFSVSESYFAMREAMA